MSLLTHLGVRDRLPWTDTAAGVIREAALTLGSGLCSTHFDLGEGTSRFVPPLGNLPPERIHPGAAFVDWWNDSVLDDADSNAFSRRSWCCALRTRTEAPMSIPACQRPTRL
ncbi:MAG TPA: hypothetical protein VNS09_14515 [Solirubrobacter sp.]|nr:hypothetical protein [Solirubrobacter sp.]